MADRIPASLGQLAGPDHGRVSLPARLAAGESGPTGPEESAWDAYVDGR